MRGSKQDQGPQSLIILDTDPGIDDAMALLFLQARRELKLLAITTIYGNASVDITTRNALYLTQRFGIDVPVYRGAEQPLSVPRKPSPTFVHGHDGLGDAGMVGAVNAAAAEGEAADRIIELVKRHPHQVTLLAIGPLTNLALALQRAPEIAGLVKEVVLMGGAFGWAGHRGNVTPVAEANFHNDPHAADAVLCAPWPVVAVGLDVTTQCSLTTEESALLAETAGERGKFLFDISRGYEMLYQRTIGLSGCCLHDVAAVVWLVQPSLFTTASGAARVVTDGIARGQSLQKPDGMHFGPSAWDGLPSQRVCIGVEASGLTQLYCDTLNRAAETLPLK